MDIRIQSRGHVEVVGIAGSVDGLTAETLLSTLQAHVDKGNTRLVVDLSAVEYTSSAVPFTAHRSCRRPRPPRRRS